MLVLLALFGCPSPAGSDIDFVDDQLFGVGVRVDGVNIQHAQPASIAAGTARRVPLAPTGWIGGGVFDVQLVGPLSAEAELIGEPGVWSFVLDPSGLFLLGVECAPTLPGTYEAGFLVTDDAQPGRTFAVSFQCEVDDLIRSVPLSGQAIHNDGSVIGNEFDHSSPITTWTPADRDVLSTWPVSDARRVEPGWFGDDEILMRSSEGFFRWDGDTLSPWRTDLTGLSVWPFDDGLFLSDGVQLQRETHTIVDIGGPEVLNQLAWASRDGRFVAARSGNNSFAYTLYDVDNGTSTALDAVAIASKPRLALSEDASTLLRPFSSFGTVSLSLVDLATGTETQLLDAAAAHASTFDTTDDGLQLSDWDVTDDLGLIAVTLLITDYTSAIPVYAGAYVIDPSAGRTWFASPDAMGDPIDFSGIEGTFVQQVALSPDAQWLLLNGDVAVHRDRWQELTP